MKKDEILLKKESETKLLQDENEALKTDLDNVYILQQYFYFIIKIYKIK